MLLAAALLAVLVANLSLWLVLPRLRARRGEQSGLAEEDLYAAQGGAAYGAAIGAAYRSQQGLEPDEVVAPEEHETVRFNLDDLPPRREES